MESWPHERAILAATIDPVNNNNASFNTDNVDLSKFHEAMFVLVLGAVDTTVDFKLQESSDGSSFSDLSGKAITQMGGTDDNKQAIVSLKSEELSSGKRYVRGRLTVGNGTTNICCVVGLGMRPRFGPASDDKLSDVSQIVS